MIDVYAGRDEADKRRPEKYSGFTRNWMTLSKINVWMGCVEFCFIIISCQKFALGNLFDGIEKCRTLGLNWSRYTSLVKSIRLLEVSISHVEEKAEKSYFTLVSMNEIVDAALQYEKMSIYRKMNHHHE